MIDPDFDYDRRMEDEAEIQMRQDEAFYYQMGNASETYLEEEYADYCA